MTPTEKAIEGATTLAVERDSGPLGSTIFAIHDAEFREGYKQTVTAAFEYLISLHPGIAQLIKGTGVVVEISTLREVERLSRSSCLVPPDGGEPTEQEAHISNVCGNIIREMADRATLAAAEKEKQG